MSEFAKLDEKSVSILVKTFFFFFFFGDHLILGGKKLWISDFGRKITLKFGEDLLLFIFFLETTSFWEEKSFEFRISAEKSLWNLAKTFFFFFLETT